MDMAKSQILMRTLYFENIFPKPIRSAPSPAADFAAFAFFDLEFGTLLERDVVVFPVL